MGSFQCCLEWYTCGIELKTDTLPLPPLILQPPLTAPVRKMEESYGAARERGTGMARRSSKEVAPPPPPIPRMSVRGAPPPPKLASPKLAPRMVTRDKAPAGGRGSLLSEIKTGKALKKVTAEEVIGLVYVSFPD